MYQKVISSKLYEGRINMKETIKKVKFVNDNNDMMGFTLCVAWIGAAVYFVGKVDGFWNIGLALLKACVWPAYVLYHVLQNLGV